jgi:hypothetical protein
MEYSTDKTSTLQQNQWCILLEKLTVPQLIKKFPAFTEPEGSLPCLKQRVTCPYPETDDSCPHHPILLLWDTFHHYTTIKV